VRRVPARWWCTFAIFATAAAGGSIENVTEDPVSRSTPDGWHALSYACFVACLIVLPIAAAWSWRLGLVTFAVGAAYVSGLLLADALTYSTLQYHCNHPYVDQCDPGPFGATFLAIALPVPVLAAAATRFGRAASRERQGGLTS
jgi:hypothetical protein